jgi:putative membrane protein
MNTPPITPPGPPGPPGSYRYTSAAVDGGRNDAAVELSARRTGMSFQRTRMSTDRTLMSVMRTSISLISFGFTIGQFFEHLRTAKILAEESHAPRNFGVALVALGIGMLVLGIVYHLHYMRVLRAEREAMTREGLIHGETPYPVSLTLLVASVMLLLGVLAIISMTAHIGPFD